MINLVGYGRVHRDRYHRLELVGPDGEPAHIVVHGDHLLLQHGRGELDAVERVA